MHEDSYNPQDGKFNDAGVIAVIAYFAFIGWFIALILNNPKSEFASFHIRQALGVHLVFVVSGFVMIVPILGWVVGFVGFFIGALLWFVGILGALKKETRPLSLWGNYFQEWFQAL